MALFAIRKMCGKAVAACLSALKFVSDWFITCKMLDDLDNALSCNDNIDLDIDDPDVNLFNDNSNNITFSKDIIGFVNYKL